MLERQRLFLRTGEWCGIARPGMLAFSLALFPSSWTFPYKACFTSAWHHQPDWGFPVCIHDTSWDLLSAFSLRMGAWRARCTHHLALISGTEGIGLLEEDGVCQRSSDQTGIVLSWGWRRCSYFLNSCIKQDDVTAMSQHQGSQNFLRFKKFQTGQRNKKWNFLRLQQQLENVFSHILVE